MRHRSDRQTDQAMEWKLSAYVIDAQTETWLMKFWGGRR